MESDEKAAFQREKYVKIMTDYSADPVWDKDGLCTTTDWLPVTPDLIEALDEWEREFDLAEPPPYDPRTTFDHAEHMRRGLELARRVKGQLPDWTVIFHEGADPVEVA